MRNFNIISHIINLKLFTNNYIKNHIIILCSFAKCFPFYNLKLKNYNFMIISSIAFRFNKKKGFLERILI